MNASDKLLSRDEVAECLGASISTVVRLESEPEPERDSLSPEYRRLRDQARDEIYALLTAPLESDPEMVLEREEKRQARELRRECNRMRLEASLGFDEDLIALVDKEAG